MIKSRFSYTKLTMLAAVFTVTAGFALGIVLKSRAAASSSAPVTAAACVTDVKVRALGNSDFEITWNSTESCQVDSFLVIVNAYRKVGGNILGEEQVVVTGSSRRAVVKFRSILGIERVDARVILRAHGSASVNL